MRARLNQRGFTAVELMVALTIGGIVTAAIASVLRHQQRFFTNAAALVEQRVSLRDATGIVPGELRALSPAGGDVVAFSDSSLEMRATIGTAIACDTVPGGNAIALAPARGSNAALLTSFSTSPQPGDVAQVYDAGAPSRASDDGWISLDVSGVWPAPTLCAGSPLVDPVDVSARPLQLRFTAGNRVSSSVRPGAFIRVLRRVRYRFYRAGTGDWYLGYSEWDATAFGVVQPVSGPFASYARRGGGLSLRYFDETGAELFVASDAPRIARVSVIARGLARGALAASGEMLTDSQTVTVRVRNR